MLLLALRLLAACNNGDISVIKVDQDDDGDGFTADIDCDDTSADIHPDADEVCDGWDNDCDGTIDTGAVDAGSRYPDADLDGFGEGEATVACEAPDGMVDAGGDCDDADDTIHPEAVEVCDGVDNNCNDDVDGADAEGALDWYADADTDGYGDPAEVVSACDAPEGYLADAQDCDDTSAERSPAAVEACNGVDDDCDGAVDEAEASDASTWYADLDGDGSGDPDNTLVACDPPTDYVADATDCDDTNASVNLGGTEVCDGIDDDCDGVVDEDDATDASTWYADADADGYGDAAVTAVACAAPAGFVADATDCDDAALDAYPGADEYCDGADHDCDGAIYEAGSVDAGAWYTDADSDGYGDLAAPSYACVAPAGSVADDTDCADTNAAVNPGASEVCDGTDNDCDAVVDEADAADAATWYADTDGDGYGTDAATVIQCDPPGGYAAADGDCDEGNAAVNPAATETCEGTDEDCDGEVDEADAADASTWHRDEDEDGYGDPSDTSVACDVPSGYVADGTDCDDTELDVFPGAEEYCDGIDHDCDGAVDEGESVDALLAYTDADEDGYGAPATVVSACEQPADTILVGQDCDDTDDAINPDAVEVCDGVDNACLGGPDWNLNVPAVYTSIQDAIDAAASGGTVCVAAGTYTGLLTIQKPLTLEGYDGGSATTVIDGGGTGRALYASYLVGLELRGFTITGGVATGDGGGLYLHHATGVAVEDVVVTGNHAGNSAGGVGLQDAEATFADVYVHANTLDVANAEGAGVAVITSLLVAENLWISDNVATFSNYCEGAGIFLRNATVDLTNAVIAGNTCTTTGVSSGVRGAAGASESSAVTLTNVTIVGNTGVTRSRSADTAGWYYTSDYGDPFVAVNVTSTHNTVPGASTVYAGAWAFGGTDPSASFRYSNAWSNDGDTDFRYISDPTEIDGNISADPLFADRSAADAIDWDLSLSSGSDLLDAGDPSILDADGSRSDMGAFGGPGGGW